MNYAVGMTASSDFEIKSLPFWLEIPNRLAAKFGNTAPNLSPENLIRTASRRVRLAAKFPSHVETALEVLCRSLHDDAKTLHWFGKMNQHNLIVTGLAEFLKVEEIFRTQPELENVKLNSPVIITGLPRSGTTFLHRLLSPVEEAEAIPLYRHLFPTPRLFSTQLIEGIILFEPWKWASQRYQIDAIHFVRPNLPDECNFGMRLIMRSPIFWSMAPTYGYLNWLLEQDLRETYQFYRRVLILHQMQEPHKRLTLKCPHHLASLPALREALPEAHIIQTHRDPLETTPSECSLVLSLQALSVSSLDWKKTVTYNYHKVLTGAERSIDFANSQTGKNVLHVDYRQLVQNPVQLAGNIHKHFGLAWNDEHQARLEKFFATNRQNKHGKHHYSLEQFGLHAEKINSDFRNYRERFLSN